MTKEDWIKLAQPAATALLAVSIIIVPLIAHAMEMGQSPGNPLYVEVVGD